MIYLGTVGWNYKFWCNNFYPTEDQSEWLPYYASKSLFSEIRSSFGQQPSLSMVEKWNERTPNQFIFALNMSKDVTHNPKNSVDEGIVEEFFARFQALKQKIGIVLLHFPYKLQNTPKTFQFLKDVLAISKKHHPGDFAVSLTNRSWNKDEVRQLLSDHSAVLVSSDKHPVISTMRDKHLYYLRLLGDTRLIRSKDLGNVYHSRESDLQHWANHLKIINKRHQNIFVSIDNHFSGHPIRDLTILSKQLQDLKVDFTGFKIIQKNS